MNLNYDVVVVGAGPAGCMAAGHASERGAKVLMVERKSEVGVPSHCAGFLMKRAEDYVKLNENIVATPVRGFKCYAPGGHGVTIRGKELAGYVVRREALDKHLATQAVKSGADLMVNATAVNARRISGGVRVRVLHLGEKIQVDAKLIVGADGAESNVAKWFGLEQPSELIPCAQFEALTKNSSTARDLVEIYVGQRWAPRGFAWIFPKEVNTVKVGVGAKSKKKPPIAYLKDFVSRHPIASRKLSRLRIIKTSLGTVPLSGPVKQTVANNVILTGTAAGMVNPVSGGGNDYAIICGAMAGDVAAEAIAQGDVSMRFLRRYEEDWRGRFEREFRMGTFGKMVLQNMPDRLFRSFFSSLEGEPGVLDIMLSYDAKRLFRIVCRKVPVISSFINGIVRLTQFAQKT